MRYKVPFNDLSIPDPVARKKYTTAIDNVLRHGQVILGPEVTALETQIAAYCNRKYAVGTGSGTDSLIISLLALGIGQGDEVIIAAMSWIASATAIRMVGAKPVFIDVNAHGLIDPAEVEPAITSKTKAIMVVDYSGKIAAMEELEQIAEKHDLLLIEDAAQAFGATRKGRHAGQFGVISCFSMNPMKVFGAFGEAGMITTDSAEIRDRLVELRYNGMRDRKISIQPSINARIDTLHAATMLVQLEEFPERLDRRRKIAARYSAQIDPEIITPYEEEYCSDTFFCYAIRAKNRDQRAKFLIENGVEVKLREWDLLPAHPSLKDQRVMSRKNASMFSKDMICLPIYDKIQDQDVDYVCEIINAVFKND